MATTSGKTLCSTCNKEKPTFLCDGCSRRFCMTHLHEHQQVLQGELDGIIQEHDQIRQLINERPQNPSDESLIEQIDRWERTAIDKIRARAEECRRMAEKETTGLGQHVEAKLSQFTDQLRRAKEENEFNELDLRRLNEQLDALRRQLTEQSNVTFAEDSQTLINDIRIVSSTSQHKAENKFQRWNQHAMTIAGGHGCGSQLNQLNYPYGIRVDQDKALLIADLFNHRIVRYDANTGNTAVVAGGNGQGQRIDQLNGPSDVLVDKHDHSIIVADQGNRRVVQYFDPRHRTAPRILTDNIHCWGLAMDNEGFLYVSDVEKHEVRRWKDGRSTVVAGGNKRGDRLDQLNDPLFLFVDAEQSVFVSDMGNARVVKWQRGAKQGTIVAGGLNQLSSPRGVVVDRSKHIYVADFGNAQVVRWREGESEGELLVGGKGKGQRADQLHGPKGLSLDDDGNLYVADSVNARVQRFSLSE